MKKTMIIMFAFLSASCADQKVAAEKVTQEVKVNEHFEVKISPEKVKLNFSSNEKDAKKLVLSIVNRTKEAQVFNRFYECWYPILISESGEEIKLSSGADYFRRPVAEDYPRIPVGKSRSVEVSIGVYSKHRVGLSLATSHGTCFDTQISAGRYKLCLEYDSKESEWLKEKRTELRVPGVFQGKKRSNVIEIVIGE